MFFRNIKIRQSRWKRLIRSDFRKPKWVLAIIAVIVLYVEFFNTFLNSLFWSSKQCTGCIRVLLVADPQIGGEVDEPFWLFRWDSDRYLSKWYARAFSYFSPQAILFLGDLMDEGSKATDEEFQRYTERFFDIFPVQQGVKYFYLPGDNDIGGEDGEPIFPHVVQRFYHTFENSAGATLGPVHFLKVNVPLEAPPISHFPYSNDDITILLSHFPLLSTGAFSRTPFSVRRFRPSLVISAHSHMSHLRRFGQFEPSFLDKFNMTARPNMQLEELNEISVPTCSYRMGVSNIGYGSLVIDPTQKEIYYSVLWLPGRFFQLFILAICGFILSFYLFVLVRRSIKEVDVLRI